MTEGLAGCRVNRRTFLQGALALSLLGGKTGTGSGVNLGYVDAHSHLWSPERTYYPLVSTAREEDVRPRGFTLGDFFQHAAPEGVNRVVVPAHHLHFGAEASYMTDLLKARAGQVAVQAWLKYDDPDAVQEMKKLEAQGVKAFRLVLWHPFESFFKDSDPIHDIYEYAALRSLVVCPLTNPDWLPQYARLAQDHPATTVVIDHFARIGVDNLGTSKPGTIKAEDVRNLTALGQYPRHHVKISAFYALGKRKPPYDDMIPLIKKCLLAFGPERLMWGSDRPYQLMDGHTYKASIALVRDRLDGVSVMDREWLLRKTAERMFFT